MLAKTLCSKIIRSQTSLLSHHVILPSKGPKFGYIQQYYFSKGPDRANKKANKPQEQPSEKQKTIQGQSNREEKSLSIQKNFKDYIQNKDSGSSTDYEYITKKIYELSDQSGSFRPLMVYQQLRSALWSGLTGLTYFILPSWLAIIPGLFLGRALVGLISSYKITHDLIYRVDLLDNNTIKVYPLSMKGGSITCNIQDTRVHAVAKMPTRQGTDTYIVFTNFTESVNRKFHKKMVVFVDFRCSVIPNMDLLKGVLHGDTQKVSEFRYTGSQN